MTWFRHLTNAQNPYSSPHLPNSFIIKKTNFFNFIQIRKKKTFEIKLPLTNEKHFSRWARSRTIPGIDTSNSTLRNVLSFGSPFQSKFKKKSNHNDN